MKSKVRLLSKITPTSVFIIIHLMISSGLFLIHAQPYTWTKIAGSSGVVESVDGTNGEARFFWPYGIAADRDDNLYITEVGPTGKIRKLTRMGTNWVSTTVASGFNQPQGVVLDDAGNLFIADSFNLAVRKLTPSGTNWLMTTIANLNGMPYGIALDKLGNIYVADGWGGDNTIRSITPAGPAWVSTILAGTNLYLGGLDGPANSAQLGKPYGVAVSPQNTLYFVDWWGFTVRQLSPISTNGYVTTLAGAYREGGGLRDGTNTDAHILSPSGIALDSSGSLFVVDEGYKAIRKVTPIGTNWVVTTVGGRGDVAFNFPYGIAVGSHGDLYVTDNFDCTIWRGHPFVPELQVTRQDSRIAVSWSLLATGFVLETSSSLGSAASWMPITKGIGIAGNNFLLTNQASATAEFYRLRK